VNPLQFLALKPADHLAQKALKQLELALETRKKRESVNKDEALLTMCPVELSNSFPVRISYSKTCATELIVIYGVGVGGVVYS